MNALVEFSLDVVMDQTGQRPDVRRRLSDKILAAFSHAYAVGAYDIAAQLKAALAQNEGAGGAHMDMRKTYDPLGEAELWTGFIDARNRYRTACENNAGDHDVLAEALGIMKDAYRLWSRV